MTYPPTWIVLGAGGHARSVSDVIERGGGLVVAVTGAVEGTPWRVPVLVDDDAALAQALEQGHRVALGVGANGARAALVERVLHRGASAPPVLALTASVARDAEVGIGSVIHEHAHVGPLARLGRGVIVNTAAVVEHDCVIGDAAHIAPGAVLLGSARVGAGAMVGSGACVLPGRAVGESAVVGAGAVVRDNVPAGRTVIGVPAVEIGSTTRP